jgi:hypothetical protein
MAKEPRRSLLFLQFFRHLRRTDRLFFFAMLAFFTLQLALTPIKLEAIPFFLYGMFSQKLPVSDTFTTRDILVNNKPLSSYRLPNREADIFVEGVNHFLEMKENKNTDVLKTRVESRYPFFYQSPVYPFFARRIYNTAAGMEAFTTWMRKKCSRLTAADSVSIVITQTTYRFYPDTLQLIPFAYDTLAVF